MIINDWQHLTCINLYYTSIYYIISINLTFSGYKMQQLYSNPSRMRQEQTFSDQITSEKYKPPKIPKYCSLNQLIKINIWRIKEPCVTAVTAPGTSWLAGCQELIADRRHPCWLPSCSYKSCRSQPLGSLPHGEWFVLVLVLVWVS